MAAIFGMMDLDMGCPLGDNIIARHLSGRPRMLAAEASGAPAGRPLMGEGAMTTFRKGDAVVRIATASRAPNGARHNVDPLDRGGPMSRLSLFNSPLLLGFDQFERALDRVSKASADGYPPYNVEQRGENALRITLAVAGFAMDDLSVQIEDNQLVVRGKQNDDGDKDRVYLHRGIAARQFQRSFVLAEGIEVAGAALDNGLLHIDLVRQAPEGRVRRIEIAKSSQPGRKALAANARDKEGA
jgi:HSP20 family molecular chaperone IbpA